MWEISSHEIPFADNNVFELMVQLANFHTPQPPIVPGTPNEYRDRMQKCWRQYPTHRPTIRYVVKKLEELEKTYDQNPQRESEDDGSTNTYVSEYDPYLYIDPNVTIESAHELRSQNRYKRAFVQFKTFADRATQR